MCFNLILICLVSQRYRFDLGCVEEALKLYLVRGLDMFLENDTPTYSQMAMASHMLGNNYGNFVILGID